MTCQTVIFNIVVSFALRFPSNLIDFNIVSPLCGPVTYWLSRLSVFIHVALTSCKLTFTNLKEVLYKNLLALRELVNRIIILTLTDLNKDIFHGFIHGRVVNITTVGRNVTPKVFCITRIFCVSFLQMDTFLENFYILLLRSYH